ncbi:MAG: hypothetical protein LBH43_03990 [Treponema sp.]|jgi:hypothetical protein|nr:hypothetical protein [Treponema sp.]
MQSKLVTLFFLVVFLIHAPIAVFADDEEKKPKTATNLQLQASTRPEAMLRLSQSFSFPFLAGSGPLTKDNNITTAISAEVTPICLAGIGEISLQPAAFFILSGGALAGSGWNMPLGNGIGIYEPEDADAPKPRKAVLRGDAFDGLHWNTWGASTFQFDLGAVIPGDWNHILFQTRQEFRYAAYTRARPGDSWIYRSDDRENQNGWVYNASYVLGYGMPLLLDTVGFMAEVKKFLGSTPGGEFWGENLGKWVFSGLFNFSFHPRFSTTLIAQMWTRRNDSKSEFDNYDYFYQDFILDTEAQRRLLFYRVALVLNYKIK